MVVVVVAGLLEECVATSVDRDDADLIGRISQSHHALVPLECQQAISVIGKNKKLCVGCVGRRGLGRGD